MRTITFIYFLFICSCSYGQTRYQKDFDFYWKTIHEKFAYFDSQKTNWKKVKTIYQPLADTITTIRSFVQLLEGINHELYNGHISLNVNLPTSNRLIPTGSDLWVTYQKNQFIITAIREGFGAEKSGLKTGMVITHYLGEPIDSAVQDFLPKSVDFHDERMYTYAANTLLAGRHHTKRSITAVWNSVVHTYYPDNPRNQSRPNDS